MNLSRTLIPDLAILQAFEAAARHGSFTKAALELNLTQSAVSRQVKTLEDQLGTLLFERVRKRVLLSVAGQQLLPDVRRLLAQSEELIFKARASADGRKVLSIATLPTFGNRWLMPRLPDFLERHPGVAVDIASRTHVFDFKEENFDVAIHYGQPVWAGATCTYFCSEVILPVASPGLLTSSGVQEPIDLDGQPLMHLATRPKLWSEWFQEGGIASDRAYRGNRFDQFSMIIEAALRGMGFALLPLYLIEDEIASGRLGIAFDRPMQTDNSYFVVLPEGRNDPLAQAFHSWMQDQLRR